ncbi:MAG: bifunctional riboflavin kinase/FAD synthetase [Ruminiclostridium sp.]
MRDITEKMNTEKTAVALGFFDGLHLGHIEVIKRALLKGGLKSVVFTFNGKTPLPKFTKRRSKIIITHESKTAILEKMGIDYIYAPDFKDVKDLTPEEFVSEIIEKRLNAGYVVCGYDFRFGKGGEGDAEMLCRLCAERGIECETVPAVSCDGEIVSSTLIRELIEKGEMEKANSFLGYEFSYKLPVEEGKKLGRTIGFPTINQAVPHYMVCPKYGVYGSWTEIDGKIYRSVTNVGVRPTVEKTERAVAETYIIGYNGDLYGRKIRIFFRFFIRPEQDFGSIGRLKEQLARDASLV